MSSSSTSTAAGRPQQARSCPHTCTQGARQMRCHSNSSNDSIGSGGGSSSRGALATSTGVTGRSRRQLAGQGRQT